MQTVEEFQSFAHKWREKAAKETNPRVRVHLEKLADDYDRKANEWLHAILQNNAKRILR